MTTPSKALETPAHGSNVDVWEIPVNANTTSIDSAFGGLVTINVVAATGTITLTSAQYIPRFMVFSGLLTANVNYQFPTGVGTQVYCFNNSTGAFTITLSSAGGGTTLLVPQSGRVDAICDGTNVLAGSASAGANSDITSVSGLTTPLSVAQGGTGAATLTGIPKGAGTTALTIATAGTDYAKPDTASTWSAKQTFNGSAASLAISLKNASEPATISATAATGTISYNILVQSILYFTSNAAANWVINLRGDGSHTLDSLMSTGDVVVVVFLVAQGGTAFYNTSVQVDGTTSGVTTKWLGVAPTSGNINSTDNYRYEIFKTAAATFTVFAAQTISYA